MPKYIEIDLTSTVDRLRPSERVTLLGAFEIVPTAKSASYALWPRRDTTDKRLRAAIPVLRRLAELSANPERLPAPPQDRDWHLWHAKKRGATYEQIATAELKLRRGGKTLGTQLTRAKRAVKRVNAFRQDPKCPPWWFDHWALLHSRRSPWYTRVPTERRPSLHRVRWAR